MAQVCLPSWNGLKDYLSCLFIVYCSGKSGLIVQTGIVQRGTARSMRTTRDGYPNLTTAEEASQGRQISALLLWAVQVDTIVWSWMVKGKDAQQKWNDVVCLAIEL